MADWWTADDEVRFAERARKLVEQFNEFSPAPGLAPVIDGLTGDQRFFVSWARTWRGKLRDEYLRQWLLQRSHAPPRYRTNGPASNLDAFYDAFGVTTGDRLYRDPVRRVRIW